MPRPFCPLLAALSGVVFGGLTSPARPAEPPAPRPPNVVLILADDLGWADVVCQGADLHETPNIDRLASQGVRFNHAMMNASRSITSNVAARIDSTRVGPAASPLEVGPNRNSSFDRT